MGTDQCAFWCSTCVKIRVKSTLRILFSSSTETRWSTVEMNSVLTYWLKEAWISRPRRIGEHRVCLSPLSSQRHKCQRRRPGCCANLNAGIVIPLAGSARDWLNLHLSPQRKEGQNCVYFFLYFSTTTHHSLKPFSSGYFWQQLCVGKCPEEGGAFKERAMETMEKQVFETQTIKNKETQRKLKLQSVLGPAS